MPVNTGGSLTLTALWEITEQTPQREYQRHLVNGERNTAPQRQTAVAACFSIKQLLLFVFARWSVCQYSMAEDNPAALRQTAVTAYLKVSRYCCLPLRYITVGSACGIIIVRSTLNSSTSIIEFRGFLSRFSTNFHEHTYFR